jgi:hypothetical protein
MSSRGKAPGVLGAVDEVVEVGASEVVVGIEAEGGVSRRAMVASPTSNRTAAAAAPTKAAHLCGR